jgi:hypothetical protein
MNIVGLGAVIFAIVAYEICFRKFLNASFRIRFIAFLVFGVLAIPGFIFSIYYLHIIPETVYLYELRSLVGSELLIVFIGAFGGLCATFIPRFFRFLFWA